MSSVVGNISPYVHSRFLSVAATSFPIQLLLQKLIRITSEFRTKSNWLDVINTLDTRSKSSDHFILFLKLYAPSIPASKENAIFFKNIIFFSQRNINLGR